MKNLIALSVLGLFSSSIAQAVDLAKVNNKSISDKDVAGAVNGLNEGQKQNILKDVNTRRQILNSLIDQEVLVDAAEKDNLHKDKEYEEAFAAWKRNYLAEKVLRKNLTAKMSESAAKSYYERNKNRFSTEQVRAQHILLPDDKTARDVLKLAKEPNADFQALAEKHSKDPSAENNRGDLGFFDRERMVPEFTEPAFAAKAGDVIGPVKTAFGYHVIKVIEKKDGKPMQYDEVELKVKAALRQELIKNYVSKLREQAKITVDDKALEKM